jgi:hypothetical protein
LGYVISGDAPNLARPRGQDTDDGIKATLSSIGTSQVVRGGEGFAEATINLLPETVTLAAPVGGAGVIELQEQPDMLNAFEGMGVAASWIFRLPKAANAFDYHTIADVIFTIEYTAIYSDDYYAS